MAFIDLVQTQEARKNDLAQSAIRSIEELEHHLAEVKRHVQAWQDGKSSIPPEVGSQVFTDVLTTVPRFREAADTAAIARQEMEQG